MPGPNRIHLAHLRGATRMVLDAGAGVADIVERMHRTVQLRPGPLARTAHDFAAFGTPPRTGGSTIRKVYQATWRQSDQDLIFEITANAFLYRMVRRILYVLVAVAQGRLDAARIVESLGEQTGNRAGIGPNRMD